MLRLEVVDHAGVRRVPETFHLKLDRYGHELKGAVVIVECEHRRSGRLACAAVWVHEFEENRLAYSLVRLQVPESPGSIGQREVRRVLACQRGIRQHDKGD